MHSFLKTGKVGADSKGESSKGKGESSKGNKGRRGVERPVPWVEKYRPKTVDDVVEQGEIVAVLKQVLEAGADLPHFLFYGPPGTGKTSTIMAAARQLFGDMYKERILELNASDDRGIQVIRDKVKAFAQLSASGTRADGRPCPPYKIVILDEADSMTHAAQAALRRTMERETKTTRFCLICNYVSSIIQPLTSRCSKFRFKPLGEGMVRTRLEAILANEGLTAEEGAVPSLVSACGGDLRRAVTALQSAGRLAVDGVVTKTTVTDVMGVVPESWINRLIDAVSKSGDAFAALDSYVTDLLNEAYSASQLVEQLQERIVADEDMADPKKSQICAKIGLVSYRLMTGGSEFTQLMDLGCTLIKVLGS